MAHGQTLESNSRSYECYIAFAICLFTSKVSHWAIGLLWGIAKYMKLSICLFMIDLVIYILVCAHWSYDIVQTPVSPLIKKIIRFNLFMPCRLVVPKDRLCNIRVLNLTVNANIASLPTGAACSTERKHLPLINIRFMILFWTAPKDCEDFCLRKESNLDVSRYCNRSLTES